MTVYASHRWKGNADLIANGVVPLGYLRKEWETLDSTYGRGTWWKLWRPDVLEAHDLRTTGMDFRYLPPEWSRRFRVVCLDGPYKLEGRANTKTGDRYGLVDYMSVEDRRRLMVDGVVPCAQAVDFKGYLLVKCQDQVCGGKVHWQTDWMTKAAEAMNLVKVDRFDMQSKGREQPPRKRKDGKPSVQQHARRGGSTLLVFQKPRPKRMRKP